LAKRHYDLYVVDLSSGRERRLTSRLEADLSPAWSPDGSLIAFSGTGPSFFREIWVVRPDGSSLRRLTHGEDNLSPAWSPDGSHIIFEKEYFYGKDTDLFTIPRQGTTIEQQIIGFNWGEQTPSWQALP